MGEAKPCLSRRPRLDVGLINFDVPAGEKTKNSYEVSRMSEMKFQVWDSDVM